MYSFQLQMSPAQQQYIFANMVHTFARHECLEVCIAITAPNKIYNALSKPIRQKKIHGIGDAIHQITSKLQQIAPEHNEFKRIVITATSIEQ